MYKEYIIGSDIGTSSARVIIFDKTGKTISEGRAGYDIIRPYPGWAEQNAEDWYNAFASSCKAAIMKSGIDQSSIKACSITHQRGSFVPVDQKIKTLRNAILWNDMRCGDQVEWALKQLGQKDIYNKTGFPPANMSLYKILWLKNNEFEIYKKTYKFLLVTDYLIARLTDVISTVEGTATYSGALDITKKNEWALDVLKVLGIDVVKFPEKIYSGGQLIGHITKKASIDTGLPEGLPIIAAGGDQPVGVLGVGINSQGIAGVNSGTSCTIEMYSKKLPLDPKVRYFVEISPEGGYLAESDIYSGISALMNWYKNNFGSSDISEAALNKKNVWDTIYDKANKVPAGSLGLMMVPYFAGTSGPYWDVRARGVITGLLESHSSDHVIRCIIEGQAYEIRKIIESIEDVVLSDLKEVRMYGGSAISDIFNQIFADVLSVPVLTTNTKEATSLGSAICATVGVNIYSSFDTAILNMVKINKRYEPIKENTKIYHDLYEDVYVKLYDRLKDLMHQTSIITKIP
jgi:sugar (pentulose or hexulose) kinase